MQRSFHCFAEAEPALSRVLPMMVLMALAATLLSGCAAPVLMRNPANGEVAQCYAPGNDIVRRYHDRDQCVEEYKKLGWEVAAAP
jgi:hypothetical protein